MSVSAHRSRRLLAVACLSAMAALVGPLASGAGAADPAPICPAKEGNARFVRFVYLNILERCPGDAASAYWTKRLDDGGSRWGFTESIDMSNENVSQNNVLPVYHDVLGRKPTDAEYKSAFDEIRRDHQDARLFAKIIASDELYDSKVVGTTTGAKDKFWLGQAYQNIVDRPPTGIEIVKGIYAFGPDGSTQASRHKIALGLEKSIENMQSWTGAVIGAGLHRAPTPADFGKWIPWLLNHDRQTFRMWTHVLSSPDGYALAQTQPNPDPNQGE